MIQPPTDNLYKFLAIFGLVVFGFSWYVPLQKLEDYNREVAKWNTAWGPVLTRSRELDYNAREALECAIEKAESSTKRGLSKDCIEIELKRAQSDMATRDHERVIAELRGGREMLDYLGKQFTIYRNLGIAFGLVGLMLCVIGFWLWYVRLQKPLDIANQNFSP